MPNHRIWSLCLSAVFALLISCSLTFAQDQSKSSSDAQSTNDAQFRLKTQSRMVVLRVVVRDAKGKPVEGLRKEDFKVFDQGKEQAIEQFDVENSSTLNATAAVPTTKAPASPGNLPAVVPEAPAAPKRLVALYFDDLNTTDEVLARGRAAAEKYLKENLHPGDRVGIFTSDKMLADFTDDPKQLNDALAKIHSSAHSLARDKPCPNLSDYQAHEIIQFHLDFNTDAWRLAFAEAPSCGLIVGNGESSTGNIAQSPADAQGTASSGPGGGQGAGGQSLQEISAQASEAAAGAPIFAVAQGVLEKAALNARTNLQDLGQVVTYVARLPGQRTVLLVSPGFFSQSNQTELDRLIDRALRLQVVVSSIDPRGLFVTMRSEDVTKDFVPTGALSSVADRLDTARELQAEDVMAELAEGTGGEFFHNDNDLNKGLQILAGSPAQYVLAFAPKEMKLDGKFHSLKVRLADKEEKGLSVQARRGYFAPRNEAEADAEAKERETLEADAEIQEQIHEALFSKSVVKQLPVKLFAQLKGETGDTRDISFSMHLDTRPLHFHKAADRNENTVIFALAVFDDQEKLIISQQRRANVHVPDAQMDAFLKSGMDAQMTFNLKPGPYKVREVVVDADDHMMAAFSDNVTVQ